jgi:cytochrome c-type biogenesis protein
MEIPFALAFTAGLVATVNPCGFAMLPAYLAYFMGLEGADGTPRAVGRGLLVGTVVSTGFLTVFGVAGVLITLGVRAVVGALPCTLPIFLVVVAGTIPQLGFVAGVLTFLVYGLGMSMLLVVVTLALALGRRAMVGWLRRSSRHVTRITGAILVTAGAYIVWFWTTTLASGGLEQSGAVVTVERASSVVTNLLGDSSGPVAVALTAVIATAVLYVRVWARRPHRDDRTSAAPRR